MALRDSNKKMSKHYTDTANINLENSIEKLPKSKVQVVGGSDDPKIGVPPEIKPSSEFQR